MSLTAFLRKVVDVLDGAGVPHMLTGSLAAAFYAVPRATQDLDVVIEAGEVGVDGIVSGLSAAGFYVDGEAALEAQETQGQFNAIDPASGWKADFIIRKDRPYSRVEFGRRTRVTLLDVELEIASLEDVLISKLEWSRLGDSELQRRDVLQLLERTWSQLDRSYVEEWVAELGMKEDWDNARVRIDRAEES